LPTAFHIAAYRTGIQNIAVFSGASLAPSTRKKYDAAWQRFKAWLPPDLDHLFCYRCTGMVVALYLSELITDSMDKNVGPGAVDLACCAISFHYSLLGLIAPMHFPNIRLLRRAATKMLQAQKSLCSTLSQDELASILTFHFLGSTPPTLRTRMHLTVFLLMFVGLLRYDDAASLLVHSDFMQFITKSSTDTTLDGVLLFLPSSKTDQVWTGAWVAIGATGKALCPVLLLRTLLADGAYDITSRSGYDNGPLLRAVVIDKKSVHSHRLAQTVSPLSSPIPSLSYTTLRSSLLFLAAQTDCGTHFGLHTGRVGYANVAASNQIPTELVCHLGRWKLGNTFGDHYTRLLEENSRQFFSLTRYLWPY
jgi:hypothetical protein